MRAQTYSTASIPEPDRYRYWESSIARYFGRLRGERVGEVVFNARCDLFDVGGVAAVRMRVPQSRVTRMACDSSDTGGDYFKLSMQLEGSADVTVGERSTHLEAGDWIMLDQRIPYTWECLGPSLLFGLQIPRPRLMGLKLPSQISSTEEGAPQSGTAPVLGAYLRALSAQLEHVADDKAALLADVAVGLLATTRESSQRRAQDPVETFAIVRLRAAQYVALHADDPTLSIDMIAQALHCSRRYLYAAFRGEALSPEKLIWKTRLDRCHAALLDPRNASRSISSIAFENGFNSDAHFARVFKARYGQSATALRSSGRRLAPWRATLD